MIREPRHTKQVMYNASVHDTVEEIDCIDPGIAMRNLFLTAVWNTRFSSS